VSTPALPNEMVEKGAAALLTMRHARNARVLTTEEVRLLAPPEYWSLAMSDSRAVLQAAGVPELLATLAGRSS